MLLYRSLNSLLTSLYNTLENVIGDSFTDIVLGDFNIDILNSTNINLNNVLSNYTLLVNEPTYVSGALLDHVYVNNDSLQKFLLIAFIFLIMMLQSLHLLESTMRRQFMFVKKICLLYVLHI